MVEYHVYNGPECQEGAIDITSNDFLLSRLRPDLSPVGDGSGIRSFKVELTIDPQTIANSSIFEDLGTSANVYFCVRFSVFNEGTSNANAIEVNFVETPVLLEVNLLGNFSISSGYLTNAALVLQLAQQNSYVQAYLCDQENNVVTGSSVKNQGQSVRVCVRPIPSTMQDGVFLRQIEEFTFRRDNYTQVAIAPNTGGVAANQLTVVSCVPGSSLCAFETLLSSEFFTTPGVVNGNGSAYLQFGTNQATSKRRQMEEWSARRLQTVSNKDLATTLDKTITYFNFDILALPAPGNSTSSGTSLLAVPATIGACLLAFAGIFW